MATERNPFDPIPQVQVTQIEIEPEGDTEQEATIEYDNTDGGVIVEFKNPTEELLSDEQIEETDDEFYRNLADEIDDDVLQDISQEVYDNFVADKDSRGEWESMFERGFDLLGLKLEEAS